MSQPTLDPGLAGPPRGLGGLVSILTSNVLTGVGLVLFVAVVLMALTAPWISPADPLEQSILTRMRPPSETHWLGTDVYGRDVLSRLFWGARISLIVGVTSIVIALVVGTALGLIAGYKGGWVDSLIMRAMDILLSIPGLILGLILVAMLGNSIINLIVAISVTAIAPFARIARAPTVAIKEREFIDAARSMGFSEFRVMVVHILPNIAAEILVMASLWLATAIRIEASLSFIGLGVTPPTPSWGGMIREGFDNILDAPWLAVFPSIAILIVVLSLNLVGDGLRDAVDPKTADG